MLTTALLWLVLAAPLPQELVGQAAAESAADRSSDYRLGPADVLSVSVLGLEDFTQPNQPWLNVVVSNSGRIHLPHVGVLSVNNMTPAQLQAEVANALRQQDLVRDPQVTVRVREYRAQTIYIIGEVLQPGQYYMREEMYLLDLIGLSLGFPTDGTMYLYRRRPVSGHTGAEGAGAVVGVDTAVAEALPVDIRGLAEGRRPDLNVRLQGGDVLYVPFNRPKFFYATGDVNNPGAIEIPLNQQVLVSQAIAFAGGPTKTAKMSKGILVRWNQQGDRDELAVDFDAILRGRKPDFPVEPDDIIFIPGSSAKTLAYGLLNIVPSIAVNTIW